MVFDVDRVAQIEENLRPRLQDELMEILVKLNRDEELETFCRMIGAEDLLGERKDVHYSTKSGLIVVIGESRVKENVMQGVLKDLGIRKERLECHLGYADAKSFPWRTLQYQPKYSLVLVGSMGHKAQNIGDHSSAIGMMEQEEGYPPVKRLGTNELKITKSNFQEAIKEALEEGILIAS